MPYSPKLYKKQTPNHGIDFDALDPLDLDILNPHEKGAVEFSNLYDYKISLLLTSEGAEPIEKVRDFFIALIRVQYDKGANLSDIRRIMHPYVKLSISYQHQYLIKDIIEAIRSLPFETEDLSQNEVLSRRESIIIKGSFSLSQEEVNLARKARK